MSNFLKKSLMLAFGIVTGVFMFLPESVFKNYKFISQNTIDKYQLLSDIDAKDINIVISRILCFILIWIVTSVVYKIYLIVNNCITIKGENYLIQIEYGDIYEKDGECKRVISFDECFTTNVGENTADVNPSSVCGQYLIAHPDLDIQQLIVDANIKPTRSKSKYQQKTRYDSGTIVPNGDDLLMAFVKLDERGKGRFFLVMSILNV